MVRSEKKLIIAPEHRHALHYARMMEWKREEWSYVGRPEHLKGQYNVVVYDVRVPGFRMSPRASDLHQAIRNELLIGKESGRIVKVNVVNLP